MKILLIVVDTLTREYGVIFEKYFNYIFKDHISTDSWTYPAHRSILCSKPTSKYNFSVLREEVEQVEDETTPKILNGLGIKKWYALVGAGKWLNKRYNWGRDWTDWRMCGEKHYWKGEKIEVGEDTFQFVHTHFLHDYCETKRSRQEIKDLKKRDYETWSILRQEYEKRVWIIFKNLAWINEPEYKDYTVILTSDHGELFLEDGINSLHGVGRFNNKVFEVPLMFRLPERKDKYYYYGRSHDYELNHIIKCLLSHDNNLKIG